MIKDKNVIIEDYYKNEIVSNKMEHDPDLELHNPMPPHYDDETGNIMRGRPPSHNTPM